VSQAEAALNEAWKTEIEKLQQEAHLKEAELEAQVLRLMTQMGDARREDESMVSHGRMKILHLPDC
jgi:hypothetical protein